MMANIAKIVNNLMKLLIVGSGPIGSILANCLAEHDLDIVVVDKVSPAESLTAEYDGRTSAISRGSFNFLNSVGLGQLLIDEGAPINQIHVSDQKSHNFVDFDAKYDGAPMGYIIENRNFRQYLYDHISHKPNVKLIAPATVEDLQFNNNGVTANINGEKYRFDLCIAADGRNSITRDTAGITTQSWPYDQTAFVSVIEHTLPHDNIAFEHFTTSGPIAFLPMNGNKSSLVWSINNIAADDLDSLTNEEFCEVLQSRFGNYLGDLKITNRLWKYPLSAQYAKSYFATRLALAGDAAHSIHPVAGQGLNLGIRDCETLNQLIKDQINLGLDIGSKVMLEKYQKQRMFDNATMLGITDTLVNAYSNSNPILGFIRSQALGVANAIPPLKKLMMKHATGTL